MKAMSNARLFGAAVLAGALLMLALLAYANWSSGPMQPPAPPAELSTLTPGIGVAGQLRLDDVPRLQARGYATVIALRPDGEEPGQPTAAAMEAAARAHGLHFAHVPVPKGDAVPDAVVASLGEALAAKPGPVLLYCRSGRRAARAWSLAEASRPGGLAPAEILAAVQATGHSADDLQAAIAQRVAQRSTTAAGETR